MSDDQVKDLKKYIDSNNKVITDDLRTYIDSNNEDLRLYIDKNNKFITDDLRKYIDNNNSVITEDLHQYIDSRLSQSETAIRSDIRRLRKETRDGFRGVADAIEIIHDEHHKLEQRVTRGGL